ncbi:MAG: hypothetical protein ABS36_03390 [Acidobacteria bacterium SCN 69-37]|nr:MAG: hypothetical protein ABS36_03390 [Acidobacteria bacterium SCN 69-37]
MRVLLLLTAAIASCVVGGVVASQGRAPENLQLFLLAGQSNMAGRGEVAPEDRVAHSRVWMFDRGRQWVPAIEPMHFDKPIAGAGPGRAFGLAVAEALPDAAIGLIPTAVGGSPITAWEAGVVYQETGALPWDEAIARTKAAMTQGRLRGILWHQGESDGTDTAGPLYEQRLRSLIARFRAEFGDPDLPFLIGQLGRFDGKPWSHGYELVDAAHRRVAAEVPFVAFVSSEGLRDKGDQLHFSAESARTLGRRYAEAWLRMATH